MLHSPQHIAKTYPAVEVYIVEAREEPENVPPGQEPIHWVLVTTHPVATFQQACQLIQWYALRWNIEQVFRLLKTKGFNVEASQLEEGNAIIRSCLLAMLGASKIILLHRASKQQEAVPIQQSFTTDQQACIRGLCSQYEGKTLRQKNPYSPDSLHRIAEAMVLLGHCPVRRVEAYGETSRGYCAVSGMATLLAYLSRMVPGSRCVQTVALAEDPARTGRTGVSYRRLQTAGLLIC